MTFFERFLEEISLAQELGFFLRIIIASLCGACIGFERTRRFKEAGIRTHVLVACASALMMIVSKYAFVDLQSAETGAFLLGTRGADASRIAAQVVTGISFLGAGVIFKLGSSVRGLTTAAGIWATSGIGLAIGAGMYFEGIFVTALVLLSQMIMHKVTIGKDSVETVTVTATVMDGKKFREKFKDDMEKRNAKISFQGISKNDDGTVTYKVDILLSRKETISDLVIYAGADENIRSFKYAKNV